MKCLIVDDEKNGSETLELLLKDFCPEVTEVKIINSSKDALIQIPTLNFDLLFLDIQMPFLNGFELLDSLTERNFQVVFCTAFDEYALKAFKVNAIDYLLKPVALPDLKRAVKKAHEIISSNASKTNDEKIDALLELASKNSRLNKIAIKSQDEILFVDLMDIIRVEADSNYSIVYLKDGTKHTTTRTLKDFEKQLTITGLFFRVHDSHIVGLNFIHKLVKEDGGYLIMNDGSNIYISRRRKQDFLDVFEK